MRVHLAYTLCFLSLAATGFLLFFPDLRMALTSGYSLVIGRVHKYAGAAAVPVLLVFGRTLVQSQSDPTAWRRAHSWLVVGTGALLAVSGVVLWFPTYFSEVLVNASTLSHQALTFVVVPLFILHLIMIRVTRRAGR